MLEAVHVVVDTKDIWEQYVDWCLEPYHRGRNQMSFRYCTMLTQECHVMSLLIKR